MTQVFEIRAFGFNEAAHHLERVALRTLDARPAFEAIEEMLERAEESIFNRFHGKYVKTGRLMDSLTQPRADDAVRDAHAEGLDFGTATWYARFHKDAKGKSPYLKLRPKDRKEITRTLMDYIVGDESVERA